MELLVLGDSVPFGRPHYGICRDRTWPYLLGNELGCSFQMRAKGGATMIDVMKEVKLLHSYWFEGLDVRKFDTVLIQAGIVDCCPRLAPRSIYGIMRRLPGFTYLERREYAYRILGRSWTSRRRFAIAVKAIVSIMPSIASKFYFIEIANPANHLLRNVGDFSDLVLKYNSILKEVAGSGSCISWADKLGHGGSLLPDGHHLTFQGHRAVFDACLAKLNHSAFMR